MFRRASSMLLVIARLNLLKEKHTVSWKAWRRMISDFDYHKQQQHKNDRRNNSSRKSKEYGRVQSERKLVKSDESPVQAKILSKRIPYPKEITTYLDQFVIGQHHAKKTLAVGVYQHYKRLEHNAAITTPKDKKTVNRKEIISSLDDSTYEALILQGIIPNRDKPHVQPQIEFNPAELKQKTNDKQARHRLEKSNIILLGPSGVGKTYLTQMLAGVLDVPIAMCDCTVLTQAGYVGDDVDTVIQKLLQNADGDVERTQRGIVFLDEFDKISSSVDSHSHGMRDVSGRGVQQALLKLVEGTVVKIKGPPSLGSKVDIDTSNILFVASGAFNNLDRIVARRLHQKSVGFGAYTNTAHDEYLMDKDEKKVSKRRDELLRRTDQADLINFGMVPELIGRFPVHVPFHGLDEHLLMRIMGEPKNSVISQAVEQFSMDNVHLRFTDSALEQMARLAVQKKTGARALRAIVENVLLDAKYEVPGAGIETVIIDEDVVMGNSPFVGIATSSNSDGQAKSLMTPLPHQLSKLPNLK